ncbi:hypothetical protein ACLMJK_006171 [Lecanora helva]
MAGKRQDRLLERQRGAGTRQIKNIGFDLLLPGSEAALDASLQPQPSGRPRKDPQTEFVAQKSGRSRKSIQPELAPQRSSRRTPVPDESGAESLVEKPSASKNPRKRGRPKALLDIIEESAAGASQSKVAVKKRKIDKSTKVSKGLEHANDIVNTNGHAEVQVKDSQNPEPAEKTPPGKKRKKRKSIGQQSTRKPRPSARSPLQSVPILKKSGHKLKDVSQAQPVVLGTPEPPNYSWITTPAVQETQHGGTQSPKRPTNEARQHDLYDVEVASEKASTTALGKVVKRKARKKRKPIGQQSLRDTPKKKDNRSTVSTKWRADAVQKAPPKSKLPQPPVLNDENPTNTTNAIVERVETQPPMPETKKKRGRPPKVHIAAASNETTAMNPQQQRIQKSKSTKPPAPKSRKPPKNISSIKFHAPPSPTSLNANPDAVANPPSNPTPQLAAAKDIHSIDLLCEICLVLISSTSARLTELANQDLHEFFYQQQLMDAYGKELKDRMIDFIKTLNETMSLNTSVTRQAAEEMRLRKEVNGSKAERKRKDKELKTLLAEVGEVVKKGWAMQAEGHEAAPEG